jgi:hypothetical protein
LELRKIVVYLQTKTISKEGNKRIITTMESKKDNGIKTNKIYRFSIKDGDVVAFDGKYGRGVALMADGYYYYGAYNLVKRYSLSMTKRLPEDLQLFNPTEEDMCRAKEKFGDFEVMMELFKSIIAYQRNKDLEKTRKRIEKMERSIKREPQVDDFIKRLIHVTKQTFKNDIEKADGIRMLMMLLGREDAASELDEWIESRKANIYINPVTMEIQGNLNANQVNDIHGNEKVNL